jgi:hypothetical protein
MGARAPLGSGFSGNAPEKEAFLLNLPATIRGVA